ncbi:MAG: RND family transporter [Lentihominibacter sp.]
MGKAKLTLFKWITGHCKSIVTVFILLAVICAMLKPLVGVNYDIKDYLPEDSVSTVALNVMQREYEEGVPNARAMLTDVSVPEAIEYKEKIENVPGVDSVTWLDDSVNPAVPVEVMDEELADTYYKDKNALFQITIDKNQILTAVPEIEKIIGDENALTGDAVSTAVATRSTVKEIRLITILAVILVLVILVFATESWLEPIIVLVSIGVAIVINSGTNIIFGEISFVTNAAGSILQLAVSLDYAVFLIHRYHKCRPACPTPRQGMIEALSKSGTSILSSGITTVIGFMALVLMRFQLGPDLGWALAKGVAISLISVFVFLPALYLLLNNGVEKTVHRSFIPSFGRFGKLVTKVMVPCVLAFAVIIVPAFAASNANSYYYGPAEIFGSDTKLGSDTDRIEKVYGESDTYALLLPAGHLSQEKAVSEELHELDHVTSIISYVDSVGAEIPAEYLNEDVAAQLNSDSYTRMVINVDVGNEGNTAFETVDAVKAIAHKYYRNDYYLAGSGPSNHDLKNTVEEDMLKVNLLAIAAVYLILLFMMKSLLLPALLVASIETAIWINTAIPFVTGSSVFYIAYLIISTVQLGATVDYAIMLTDRYRECRLTLDKKEAVAETISWAVPSILVSGLALTIVGTLIGIISTHGLLAQLGVFIGRGAVCSMCIVFFVLPGLLYLFDKLFIKKGKKKK